MASQNGRARRMISPSEMRGRRVARTSSQHCDFCGLPRAQIGKLVVSPIGGTPASICVTCVIDAAMSRGFVISETRLPTVDSYSAAAVFWAY